MGSSTLLRISSGLLTFAFVARILGPESFGQFMLWFSVATLLGLVANYGLTPYMLREITIQEGRTSQLIGEVLMAKLLLALILIAIVLPSGFFIDTDFRYVFFALFVATLFDSLTEFFNAGYRATNRYASETKIATYTSVFQFLLIVLAVYFSPTVLSASLATMMSRILVSFITWRDQNQFLNGISLGSIESGINQLKEAFAYAVDFVLQSLMGQVDSIVIGSMLGLSAVGIYQAGMKIFQGCAQTANVLANVFIPRLSKTTHHSITTNKDMHYVQICFIGVGILLGLIMAVAASPITHLVFGPKFSQLVALFPWFGLLFFIRFFAASQGIILTSAGLQSFRTYANVALWLVVFTAAYLLVPNFGLKGWLISLIIGNAFLGLVYMTKVIIKFESNIPSIVLSLFGLILFIPFISGGVNNA
jgi:O-antigen/teichoic acid export membrane protein